MNTTSNTLSLNSRLKRLSTDEAGMTLLEILVVMVILGLLATLGSIQLMGYLGRARTDTARLQIQEIMTALDLYRIDVGRLPSTQEGLAALVERPAGTATWRGPYLRAKANLSDPWRHPYQYRSPGTRGEYDLASLGADGQPGGESENSDVTNWTE
ncbi:type II secretion system major pseudopilin GspG [Microvirga sp. 2YAF29]|uniref:type II secretion system major pseudopilin GspG n=1 Tax=Microvirga sp. 2YAF29 TaxID=3233031 RepID=UPI003F958C5F